MISPPCPISQQESNWPLLAVSKTIFDGAGLMSNQPAATGGPGLTANVPTKLAADVRYEDAATSGGDWADDEVQMELDEDDAGREGISGGQDEQGEGWGDTDLELPPDLVSDSSLWKSLLFFRKLTLYVHRKELAQLVVWGMKMMLVDILLHLPKANLFHNIGHKIPNWLSIMF